MERWRWRSVVALALSAIYLYSYPSATITYGVVNLFHIAVGLLLAILLLPFLLTLLRTGPTLARLGWLLLAAGTVLGIALVRVGTPHRLKAWLYAHIALSVVGALLLAAAW